MAANQQAVSAPEGRLVGWAAALWAQRLRAVLPRGRTLPLEVWEQRHRFLTALLWGHVLAIFLIVVGSGYGIVHVVLETGAVALAAGVASVGRLGRSLRSASTSIGLLTASAVLVHLSGGYIEMHFHFFVMVALIALYQDWLPYLFAIAWVVLHHGTVGVIDPESVYNHTGAWEHPWRWALIHGAFILAASGASIMHWRFSENAQRRVVRAQAAREAAETQLRLSEEFLSTAAHELKTPLTTVKGTAQFLARRIADPSPEVARLSDQLQGQIMRLESLVSDLLDVSRIQQGRLELRPERCDLAALARDVAAYLEHAAERTPAHRIVVDAPEPVEGLWDRLRIEQALVNLLTNALKYSPDGGEVRVRLRAEPGRALLSIRDRGVGMTEEQRAQLFQPFATRTHPRFQAGSTGLGLYITARIVEQHGGEIAVDSTPGRGSVFTVALPLGLRAEG